MILIDVNVMYFFYKCVVESVISVTHDLDCCKYNVCFLVYGYFLEK